REITHTPKLFGAAANSGCASRNLVGPLICRFRTPSVPATEPHEMQSPARRCARRPKDERLCWYLDVVVGARSFTGRWVNSDGRLARTPIYQIAQHLEPQSPVVRCVCQSSNLFFELRDLRFEIQAPGATSVLCAGQTPPVVWFDHLLLLAHIGYPLIGID